MVDGSGGDDDAVTEAFVYLTLSVYNVPQKSVLRCFPFVYVVYIIVYGDIVYWIELSDVYFRAVLWMMCEESFV